MRQTLSGIVYEREEPVGMYLVSTSSFHTPTMLVAKVHTYNHEASRHVLNHTVVVNSRKAYLNFNIRITRGNKSGPPASSWQRTAIVAKHRKSDKRSIAGTWLSGIFFLTIKEKKITKKEKIIRIQIFEKTSNSTNMGRQVLSAHLPATVKMSETASTAASNLRLNFNRRWKGCPRRTTRLAPVGRSIISQSQV